MPRAAPAATDRRFEEPSAFESFFSRFSKGAAPPPPPKTLGGALDSTGVSAAAAAFGEAAAVLPADREGLTPKCVLPRRRLINRSSATDQPLIGEYFG